MEGKCQVAGCTRGQDHKGPHGPERREKELVKVRRRPNSPTLGPMEELCQGVGNTIGGVLDNYNADHPGSPRVGFALLMFTFGDPDKSQQWMTYISNADRESMCEAMEEFLDKQVQQAIAEAKADGRIVDDPSNG